MDSQAHPTRWKFLGLWVVATFIGWVVGVVIAIVFSYLIVNLFYPKETNLILGLVLGAVVGLTQMLAVRRLVFLTYRWVWGAAVGMGIPFIVAVVIDEIWFSTSEASDLWLVLVAVVGGAFAGVLQAPTLRPHTPSARWWSLASIAAWGLAWLTSAILGEGGFLLGGVILGAVSGSLLIWILKYSSDDKDV
jgi:uncharacterized membrane protein